MLKEKKSKNVFEKFIYFYKNSEKIIVYDVLEKICVEKQFDIKRIRRAVPLC